TLCPSTRNASGRWLSLAKLTAAMTSPALTGRVTTAGRRSIILLRTERASSYPASSAAITSPRTCWRKVSNVMVAMNFLPPDPDRPLSGHSLGGYRSIASPALVARGEGRDVPPLPLRGEGRGEERRLG